MKASSKLTVSLQVAQLKMSYSHKVKVAVPPVISFERMAVHGVYSHTFELPKQRYAQFRNDYMVAVSALLGWG